MTAPFGAMWGTLRERCEELPRDATLITPATRKRFRITEIQDPAQDEFKHLPEHADREREYQDEREHILRRNHESVHRVRSVIPAIAKSSY